MVAVKSSIARRDFLKLALLSGEALIILPVLQACDRARPTSLPTTAATTAPTPAASISTLAPAATAAPTETQTPITGGLDGLEFDRFLDESSKRFIEGWALYAEHLMWELGAYEDDPAGNIGRLYAGLRRAVRCVLDTGIHVKKWGFTKAVQYWKETMGDDGEGEVRRYIMYPAQATAYYIGFIKVMELRQKAMDAMGSRFDIKQFHGVLLNSGQVPLALLEKQVSSWIGG